MGIRGRMRRGGIDEMRGGGQEDRHLEDGRGAWVVESGRGDREWG